MIIDEDDDDENWADPGAPSGGRSCPGDGNENDDGKGEDDMQGCGKGQGQGREQRIGKGRGRQPRTERGKGRVRGRETVKGKVLLNSPQGEMISLMPLLCSSRRKCQRQTSTRRANASRYF